MKSNQSDYTEFEAKFYPVDKEKYRAKLIGAGAVLVTPERLMRRAIVDSLDYPQLTYDYIRVRDEGDSIRLSAKIHARETGNLSDQKEVDVKVSDYDKTIKIIEAMGFKFGVYQESLRETWQYNKAEITIDTWPGLETYSEIEGESEEVVKEIAQELEFDWSKRIITSVKPIFQKVYGLPFDEVNEKLKYITFENNPFTGLERKPFA